MNIRISALLTALLMGGCASMDIFDRPQSNGSAQYSAAPNDQTTKLIASSTVRPEPSQLLQGSKSVSILNPGADLNLPKRGLQKSQVRTMFGLPQQQIDPVGQPPISRWVYNDFTVYFEYQYVISSVAHFNTQP